MNEDRSGKLSVPVDFNNKNGLVQLTFFVMDGSGSLLRVGNKNYPLSNSGQVADIVNGMGAEAMETLTTKMENAKPGSAFTIICQIREQPHAVIPGLGFIDQQPSGEFYGESDYWGKLMNNVFLLFNIDNRTARRYKPDKQGFLSLKSDVQNNVINVDKTIVESMFSGPFSGNPFFFEPEERNAEGPGIVKESHPEENRTNLE